MKKQKERLVGVRSWRVTSDGLLKSLHHATVWEPSGAEAEMQAECYTTHTKGAPERKCTCGFYAFYNFGAWAKEEERYGGGTSLTRAMSWYIWTSGFDATKMVVGIISASGRVVLAQDGFRSQRAKVEAILDYKTEYEILGEKLSTRWILDEIAKKYRVPVISLDEAEAFCMVEGLQIRDHRDQIEGKGKAPSGAFPDEHMRLPAFGSVRKAPRPTLRKVAWDDDATNGDDYGEHR